MGIIQRREASPPIRVPVQPDHQCLEFLQLGHRQAIEVE